MLYYPNTVSIKFKFTTVNTQGVPTNITGPTLACFKAGNTSPDTGQCSISTNYQGIAGLNDCIITLAGNPTFYSEGDEFDAYLSAGTVDGVSVIGSVVYHFKLGRQPVDVTHFGGLAGRFDNGVPEVRANVLMQTQISGGISGRVFEVADGAELSNVHVGQLVRIIRQAAPINRTITRVISANALNSEIEIAHDPYWALQVGDRVTIFSLHDEWDYVKYGKPTSSTVNTVTLPTGLYTTDQQCRGMRIVIISQTGAGQSRLITDYQSGTRVATVSENWTTNPTTSSVFKIEPASVQTGRLVSGVLADINAEVDTALTDYDGPTNAEMEARTLIASAYIQTNEFNARTLVSTSYATAAGQATTQGLVNGVQNTLDSADPINILDGIVESNVKKIDGDAAAATTLKNNVGALARIRKATTTIIEGTVGPGANTTTIPIKTISPAAVVNDQFKGLILKFSDETASTQLRGQGTDIVSNTTTALTVSALTNVPAEDDEFVIE